MPIGYAPTVFVSSTCYDLAQVRADLKDFIESVGLDPVLSESSAFPVDPALPAVANCINAVREKADVFVLIVGRRYGTEDTSGRSVTNLEYLEAKAKGIPVYVFVASEILHNLPVWKANPDADFAAIVDTPRLFSFVDELKNISQHWVYSFQRVSDIVNHLRSQWPLLFMEALVARRRLQEGLIPASIRNLSPLALKLALEKPFGWEHLLFSRVLRDELAMAIDLERDLKFGLQLGPVVRLTLSEIPDWLQTQNTRLARIINSGTKLVNDSMKEAMGKPGEDGDVELIVYVARRLGQACSELLQWSLRFSEVEVHEEFRLLCTLLSRSSTDALSKFRSLPEVLEKAIEEAQEAARRGEKFTRHFRFKLESLKTPELSAEFDRLMEIVKAGVFRQDSKSGK